ncbi:MAG: DUF4831 family protein [Rikenellaceae bacterium]|nr:DUF4831 family protein [Rikenellaceae bacterium]
MVLLTGAPAVVYGQKIDNISTLEGYVLPRTSFTIEITQRKETIKRGPYARFSQKYLGVAAPLSDKEQYSIVTARIDYHEEPDVTTVYGGSAGNTISNFESSTPVLREDTAYVKSNTYDASGFVEISPDKYSTTDYSLEEMAAMAAERIFTIRKRRFDLVTGEAGENVFGAGLKDAIEEMLRMEEEYLALFLGKTIIEENTNRYTVTPAKNAQTTIICRFTEAKGVVPDSDLSGRPVTLDITKIDGDSARTGRDSKDNITLRIPAYCNCVVKEGSNIYAAERAPVYQFGTDMELPAANKK